MEIRSGHAGQAWRICGKRVVVFDGRVNFCLRIFIGHVGHFKSPTLERCSSTADATLALPPGLPMEVMYRAAEWISARVESPWSFGLFGSLARCGF